jgi:hypothetical protein
MGKPKYDPLIFGSIEVEEQVVKCKGSMYTREIRFNEYLMQCSTCGAIKKLSFMQYQCHNLNDLICGAILCQK